jgi:predicted Zn-dependent protease
LKRLRTRAAGFVLVAIFSFAVVSLARSVWSGGGLWTGRMEKVPEPNLSSVDAGAQKDLRTTRGTVGAALSQSGASASQRAAAYGQLGKVYLAYRLWDAAAPSLRNATALDRQSFQWPYLLARTLEETGQFAPASAAMTSALERMPNDPQSTAEDRVAARCFLAESALRENRLEEARSHLEAAVQTNPRAPYPLARLGQILMRTGERNLAAGYFDRAAAQLPARPGFRAWTVQQSSAPPGPMPPAPFPYADRVYAAVRNLDRSSAGLVRLGDASVAQGKRGEALDLFRRAVDADPASASARERHAEALIASGKREEAARELEQVLLREPANGRARAALAVAYSGSPATRDKALGIAAEFRREPVKNQPLQNLSTVYVAAGRYAEALAVCREAAALYPQESWPRLGEASMLAALGRHASARDAFEKAEREFPNNRRARLILARFLVTSPDPAARDVRRGLELSRQLLSEGPNVYRAETVAIALAANRLFAAAVAAQKNALARAGQDIDPAVRARLQRILQSFEANKPWTEPWPFHNTADPE